MNIKQAKELVLVDFIRRLGFESTSERGNDVWFRSPFRPDERTPSFKVDGARNIWYDFGRGEGGTIIDFAERFFSVPDVAGALARIEETVGSPAAPRKLFVPREVAPKVAPTIEGLRDIEHPSLVSYLTFRAIPVELARRYLKEIAYLVDGRRYFALAFENQAGGFEVRNPGFKGTVGTKDITLFEAPGRVDAAVFEGAFDFLSALAHYGLEAPRANVLVLNSVAFVDRAMDELKARDIERVFAYLDHDHAGDDALSRLAAGPWRLDDASGFYRDFKDANEYLQEVARQRSQASRSR